MMSQTQFVLYVAGRSPRSERAILEVRALCEASSAGRCELSIVDVIERPELAEAARILATPTLVKEVPPPVRRFVGDFSDTTALWSALELAPEA